MKKLVYIFIYTLLTSLVACNFRRMTIHLDLISQIADENPDSALVLLHKYKEESTNWSKGDRMYYELVKLKAENKCGIVFDSDSVISEVVDYYKDHGTSNERMLANYIRGRVYADMGEAPQALQAYFDAIECADTTSEDCDYNILIPIYGQMSTLFHQQNLPHDEIWALNHYIEYIRRYDSNMEYIIAKEQLIRPYYLLGEKDSVLHIIDDTYHELKKMGEDREAAEALISSIFIYVERNQLIKAKQVIDIFENESGLINEKGDITSGREHYYITKGFYKLATNSIDSAEFYFRKAIKFGYIADGYKGLLSVYRKKANMDSVIHYSIWNERVLDSLHNEMEIETIHRMSSLYNYSRIQKVAEQETLKARHAKKWINAILTVIVIGLLIFYHFYRLYKKKQQDKINNLTNSLQSAKVEYHAIQEELQQLKNKDYSVLIAEKEQREHELINYLEKYGMDLKSLTISDDYDALDNSKSVVLFRKKVNCTPIVTPLKNEWRALEIEFRKYMPKLYKEFVDTKKLSPLELQVCILILLDFDDSSIICLTASSPQTITNSKARANKKLFNGRGAQPLRFELKRLIRQE